MNVELATLGTLIAVLRRQGLLPIAIREQILEGVRIAKELSIEEAIAKEAGGEGTFETPLSVLNIISSTGDYQALASWTVSKQRTGKLSKVECAAEDYDLARFKLIINDEVKWEDKQLPSSLTMDFLGADIRGGKTVAIYGKSSDSSAFNLWGDICGKEVII